MAAGAGGAEAGGAGAGGGSGRLPDEMRAADPEAWAAAMRRGVSPAGAVGPGGELVQAFFRPKKVLVQVEGAGRRWGEEERARLAAGLERHGVGAWAAIRADGLGEWGGQDLRVKTCRALGVQNLQRLQGWRGSAQEQAAVQGQHKALGEGLGCWKNGTLVENFSGDVATALRELQVKGELLGPALTS